METARAGRGRGPRAGRVASVMAWQRISFSALRAAGASVSAGAGAGMAQPVLDMETGRV